MIKYIHDTSRVEMFGFHQDSSILYPGTPQRRLVCDNSTREERRDGLVCQIFCTSVYHTTCCLHWIAHPCPPLPKKRCLGFSISAADKHKRTFWPDQYFYLVRPLGGGHDKSADFTYLSSLPPPPPPHYWVFAGRGWECVLDFDNERDQGNLRVKRAFP